MVKKSQSRSLARRAEHRSRGRRVSYQRASHDPLTEEEWIREHCSNGQQLEPEAKAIEHDANERKSNS